MADAVLVRYGSSGCKCTIGGAGTAELQGRARNTGRVQHPNGRAVSVVRRMRDENCFVSEPATTINGFPIREVRRSDALCVACRQDEMFRASRKHREANGRRRGGCRVLPDERMRAGRWIRSDLQCGRRDRGREDKMLLSDGRVGAELSVSELGQQSRGPRKWRENRLLPDDGCGQSVSGRVMG